MFQVARIAGDNNHRPHGATHPISIATHALQTGSRDVDPSGPGLSEPSTSRAPPIAVGSALLTLYLVWGSTYLAIRFVVEAGWPLLGTASARFLLAGALFFGAAWASGPLRATVAQVKNAAVAGLILFVVSNGLVMWAQTRVPSGLAALLVALTPVWITFFEALGGTWPSGRRLVGVAAGLLGVAVLVDPRSASVDPLGALGLLGASAAWSVGTLWSKRRSMPESVLEGATWQFASAAVALGLISALVGETWPPGEIDGKGLAAFAWLLVGGSLIGFGAFTWLLKNTAPAVATTYAYVNPVVAAALGWQLADEPFTPRIAVASVLVLVGVAAITTEPSRRDPVR